MDDAVCDHLAPVQTKPVDEHLPAFARRGSQSRPAWGRILSPDSAGPREARVSPSRSFVFLGPWLLLAGCAPAPVDRAPASAGTADPWFVDIAAESGLDFLYEQGTTGEWAMPEIIGGGAALFDADGDGDLDIYLTNGNRDPRGGVPGSDPPRNRLYLQQADGRFVDGTERAELGDPGYGMGVAMLDFDNDGDLDLYVANYGRDRLFRNRGEGRFEDWTVGAGIGVDGWSTSVAACDYDLDGHLDLYVARYVVFDPSRFCTDPAGRREYCSPEAFPPAVDVLLRNRGDGTFEDVTAAAGIDRVTGAGLGVVCSLLDDDERPDFYVANDLDANQLWIQQPDGTFEDHALARGAAYNLEGRTESGMGVVAADLDNDADTDLFVTHLTAQSNTLYDNLGAAVGFEDATGQRGLATSSLPFTGFGTVAADLELDGDLDLVVANGRVLRGERLAGASLGAPWDAYAEPNLLYLNDGRGGFELAPEGTLPGDVEISRALAAGDIDSDGDVDLLVANLASAPRLYRNIAPRQGRWLAVRAIDPALGRDAIGARVRLIGTPSIEREITRSFGYLSASDAVAHFGLGVDPDVQGLVVRWPGGATERFDVDGVDRRLLVRRGEGRAP